jgi:hypothetical protein
MHCFGCGMQGLWCSVYDVGCGMWGVGCRGDLPCVHHQPFYFRHLLVHQCVEFRAVESRAGFRS